jgi:formiminotetrahydrofolate cyclodeaminase
MELLDSPSSILGVLAFALLVLREVLSFAKGKQSSYNMHEEQRWRSMEEALKKLTHAINNNSQMVQQVIHYTKETREDVREAIRQCKK